MTDDARFEDASPGPLRLMAMDAEDLQVISSLTQDSVFPITEMTWQRSQRRFALLLNRFRWEDSASRRAERVRALLTIEDVQAVKTQGIDRKDADLVLSLLSITLEPGEDGTGRVILWLAGDGAIAVDVEALEVTLRDVTQPYLAPSGRVPTHE
ncbi:DUF2948 family protein [Maribius pontilimi]|uniref:DUF2948 family protein n=1 Tax=Palleronia pontilimi TaxID=1964209 RepID=A0A934IJS8_9RHOB|nr:DUF2948 family protein [Palleronia pontilimi]MBJ3763850.1 DUF2948 family protein [Palleronia pontilimi]